MYEKLFKRILDIILSLTALVVLSPVLLILTIVGAFAMKGNPFFIQQRPGKDNRFFSMIKFRTMDNRKDENGNLLPDAVRLNSYGRFLRNTSLDELPELLNICKGDLSIVGPRPQLPRDLVFMSSEQKKRHTVRPGLTGLAQVNGRNNISWEEKFEYDLKYINNGITLVGDIGIILKTLVQVIKRKDISREGTETDIDFGDWLLKNGTIEIKEYELKQKEARELLEVR